MILNKSVSDYFVKSINFNELDKNDIILIQAGTGKGKSHFIKHDLFNYCKNNNKKILYLINRTITKEQFLNELEEDDKLQNIDLMTYQAIENKIIKTTELAKHEHYDYIICDEFHYWFTDALFNSNTHISADWIFKNTNNSVKILMSATGEEYIEPIKKMYKCKFKYILEIPNQYEYIKDLRFYESEEWLENKIQECIDNDMKMIVFQNSAKQCYELHQKYKHYSMFICSQFNQDYYKYVDVEKRNEVIKNQKFNKNILFTTATLDSGLSIVDDKVKTVAVDLVEPNSIIQAIGRKRILGNEKINVYIKKIDGRFLRMLKHGTYTKNGIKITEGAIDRIERGVYLSYKGEKKYIEEYGNILGKIIYEDSNDKLRINNCVAIKDITYCDMYDWIMNNHHNKMGFAKYILNKMNQDDEWIKLEDELIYGYGEFKRPKQIITRNDEEKKEYLEQINKYLSKNKGNIMLDRKEKEPLIQKLNLRDDKGKLLKKVNEINNKLEEYGIECRVKQFDYRRKITPTKTIRHKTAWKII